MRRRSALHQDLHEMIYCFKSGRRVRPSLDPERWPPEDERGDGLVAVSGIDFRGSEDKIRSLVVHLAGAADRMHIVGSGGRIGQERL